MGNCGLGDTKTYRLRTHRSEIQNQRKTSANYNRMGRENATIQTTQRSTNEHMYKTNDNYQAKNAPESGAEIAYGIHEMGNRPGKLQQYCQPTPYTEEKEVADTRDVNRQWGQIEHYLQQALTETNPRRKK